MGNVTSKVDLDMGADDFIRAVVQLILDEWKIVGNGEHMKRFHPRIIDFKYPHQIEELIDFKLDSGPASKATLMDICRKTIAYSLKTNHPYYCNSLYGGVDQFGVAGSWLTDALNSSAAIWESSPVFAVLEKHVLDFLKSLVGWKETDGTFCPGGSMANGYAMLMARQNKYDDIKAKGVFGKKRMITFVSELAHYSFCKMSLMLGHGTENVWSVKTDEGGHMIPAELEKRIEEAISEGHDPIMVTATTGTTVYGSFDPIPPLAEICQKYNIWLHADGALGGSWLLSRNHRNLLEGIESCNSLTWDLHKMASVPIYCSVFLMNKADLFDKAFRLHAEYLFQTNKYYDQAYDPGDKSIQCTRKVEAFKLFLYLKAHGLAEIERRIDNVFDMSRYFEKQISTRQNFKLIQPTFDSNNIVFFFVPDKYIKSGMTPEQCAKTTTELKRKMMETGKMMVAYQTIDVKKIPSCFRFTVSGSPVYTKEDIDFIIDGFEELGKDLDFG